mgnify:CR=1 FL=1
MIKKLHFKFFKYIFCRPYPFNHWLTLLTTYSKLWAYSLLYSLIFGLIFQISFVDYLKFYFVINFFFMIFIMFSSYKSDLFKLVYDTIEQLFRLTIGRLFGLKPINFYYEPTTNRKYSGKNILDYDEERTKVFEKKYEEIDFLVLNDYITIEEGNKRTDELLKKEYGYGFRVTLGGHYETLKVD